MSEAKRNGHCGEYHVGLASQIAEIVNSRRDFAVRGIVGSFREIRSLCSAMGDLATALVTSVSGIKGVPLSVAEFVRIPLRKRILTNSATVSSFLLLAWNPALTEGKN